MEFQMGDFKMRIPYEKFLMKHSAENPFGTMFSKTNQEFFDTLFRKTITDYTKYFEGYKRCMEKAIKMSRHGKSEESSNDNAD